MTKEDSIKNRSANLRKQAEKQLQKQSTDQSDISPEHVQGSFHELQVHQIELEMQNEELRRAQLELEISRSKYFELFDLAPIGYLTLNEKGMILEANLTSSRLLGVERSSLVKKPITRFIFREDQDIYYLHLKRLLETGMTQTFELRMMRQDGSPFWVRMETIAKQSTENGLLVYKVVINDITERKRVGEDLQRTHNELEQRVDERTVELRTALSEINTLKEQLEIENIYFRNENKKKHRFENIIGQSDGLKYVLYRAHRGKNKAAGILGLHPSTLRARMHKLGIVRQKTNKTD